MIGAAAGFIWPSQHNATASGESYEATIAPSSGSQGQYVSLNCGWHGACVPGDTGNWALDWGPTSTYTGYFRGWFYTEGASWAYRLKGYISQWSIGSGSCDETRVDVQEISSGIYRFRMVYLHTTKLNTTFLIATSQYNEWRNFPVAYMSYDTGCPWSGYHVHVYWTSLDVQSFSKATYYPNGDYCIPSPCNYYQNDDNWTRWGQWQEGS
jgi:hypothetical protein